MRVCVCFMVFVKEESAPEERMNVMDAPKLCVYTHAHMYTLHKHTHIHTYIHISLSLSLHTAHINAPNFDPNSVRTH